MWVASPAQRLGLWKERGRKEHGAPSGEEGARSVEQFPLLHSHPSHPRVLGLSPGQGQDTGCCQLFSSPSIVMTTGPGLSCTLCKAGDPVSSGLIQRERESTSLSIPSLCLIWWQKLRQTKLLCTSSVTEFARKTSSVWGYMKPTPKWILHYKRQVNRKQCPKQVRWAGPTDNKLIEETRKRSVCWEDPESLLGSHAPLRPIETQ